MAAGRFGVAARRPSPPWGGNKGARASPKPAWGLVIAACVVLFFFSFRAARDALSADAQFNELKARELQYWDEWVRNKSFEYWERMSNRELEDDVRALIPKEFLRQRQTIRVLDAGAGPLTQLGSVWPGRDLELHACDVLADQYTQLLSKYDLFPPVNTVACNVETLERVYPRQHFHLVLARDVLDETQHPQRALRGMLRALKPRGVLLIAQDRSKATRRAHENALWHVQELDGHALLVRDGRTVNLTASGQHPHQHIAANVTTRFKHSNLFIRMVVVESQ